MEFTLFIKKKGVPSAESSRSVRGLGKGVSGKPYPCLFNVRRPRLEPGTFRSQVVRLPLAPGPPFNCILFRREKIKIQICKQRLLQSLHYFFFLERVRELSPLVTPIGINRIALPFIIIFLASVDP